MPPEQSATPRLARSGWKAGALVVIGLFVALGVFVHHEANAPIGYPEDYYLAHLANVSTDARAALETYRARHQRMTVVSKHFDAVCVIMVRAARAQGAQPENFATEMTHGCEWKGKDIEDLP
jgi:hypothetical protein